MYRYLSRCALTLAVLAFLIALMCISAVARMAPVAPHTVTLFPDHALLEVKETISPSQLPTGQRGIRFTLPAQADPATLRVAGSAGTIMDISWEQVPAIDQGTVEAMRKELDGLYRTQAGIAAELQATDARIALWAEAPIGSTATAELERLDAAMDKHLVALNRSRYEITLRQKAQDESVKALEEKINRAVGGENTVWQVQAVMADAPASVAVRYSYVMGGCRWEPAYRFEALPGEQKVAFTFDAAIEQSSGVDWNNAHVSLATVERDISLNPPYLPDWLVEVREMLVGDRKVMRMEMASMDLEAISKANASAPKKVERGTYALWDLGVRSVPVGRIITLPVQAEIWKTPFVYTVRPSRDDKAYLTAQMKLPEARELPQGTAMFLVDGALIGKRTFNLSGTDVELFFGADPMVTATQRLLEKQSGNKGIIGRKQTMVWAWEMTLKNDRNHPVMLRTEEPQPQSGDEDIRIETVSKPEPRVAAENDHHLLVWDTELAPRSTATITHSVTVTAPKEMKIDFGRGR